MWKFLALEVACIALLALGVQLIVGSLVSVRAGVGAFFVTAALGWLVLLIAAQLPPRGGD